MVFCNTGVAIPYTENVEVTILILIDGFLQCIIDSLLSDSDIVTILILIDGFLQLVAHTIRENGGKCHNPYFNRWFSAIKEKKFQNMKSH